MKQKMKMKVVPENNNEYTVEIEEKYLKKNFSFFKSCIVRYSCIFIILVLFMILSIVSLSFLMNKRESFNADNCYLVEKSVVTYNYCVQNEKTITKIKFSFQALYLLCFVLISIIDIILLVLFIKDDSCIRCTKLDELNSLKEMIDSFKNSVDKNNTTTEEKIGQIGDVTGKNVTTKSINTEKSNRAGLLKHYMSCLTEI